MHPNQKARLTALRSFFHHVAASDPASIGIAQRVHAIPSKKVDILVTQYLSKKELDALISAPGLDTPRGRRDRILLTFLARTGARILEALGVEVVDLSLDGARSQVMLRGKGRKQRMVPLAREVVATIENLIDERSVSRHGTGLLFVDRHGQCLTRYGATHVVRRAVAAASTKMPELARKRISPHSFRCRHASHKFRNAAGNCLVTTLALFSMVDTVYLSRLKITTVVVLNISAVGRIVYLHYQWVSNEYRKALVHDRRNSKAVYFYKS